MKKILALASLLIAAGWAFYLYGYGHAANAKAESDIVYVRDAGLPEMVRHLHTVSERMRRQMELLDHAQKRRALTARVDPGQGFAGPLRDPFTPNP